MTAVSAVISLCADDYWICGSLQTRTESLSPERYQAQASPTPAVRVVVPPRRDESLRAAAAAPSCNDRGPVGAVARSHAARMRTEPMNTIDFLRVIQSSFPADRVE